MGGSLVGVCLPKGHQPEGKGGRGNPFSIVGKPTEGCVPSVGFTRLVGNLIEGLLNPEKFVLREGIYSLSRQQASSVKQKFKEEQHFEEDTLRKKFGSTRSIRPNVKNQYKEHVRSGSSKHLQIQLFAEKSPRKMGKASAAPTSP
ncbi:hypothetical protein Taro_030176 [Colocasia esculenta]|uniref:Uncharacterized protein n=1 Tax=Colocasia esculenta TaxID=4460 RepID=A0A843VZG2_COLES|nr:hypothetical protein [Colocasia esculenta]